MGGFLIYKKFHKKNEISFKQAMELARLPIVTFYINNKGYNFLLDSGSTKSHINKKLIDSQEITCTYLTDKKDTIYGMDGIARKAIMGKITLLYNKNSFDEMFLINDLSNTFDIFKTQYGIHLDGILGTNFFKRYKYILDFNNMVFYIK